MLKEDLDHDKFPDAEEKAGIKAVDENSYFNERVPDKHAY